MFKWNQYKNDNKQTNTNTHTHTHTHTHKESIITVYWFQLLLVDVHIFLEMHIFPLLFCIQNILSFFQEYLLTHSLTYLLTYSMVQSPSWEANWFAASQEIPRISRNPKVHYRTHKRPPPVSILGQPIQSIYPHPTSWWSVLILSTHLCLGPPSGLFPSGFSPRIHSRNVIFACVFNNLCHFFASAFLITF